MLYFEKMVFEYSKLIGWSAIGIVALCLLVNILLVMPCQFTNKLRRMRRRCRRKKVSA